MYVNRLSLALRFLLFVLIVGLIFGVATLRTHIPAYAAGTQPTWALPFPTGTSVYIGPLGLHDHNFGSMQDDHGKVFTFSNKHAADSLDFVLQPPTIGTSTIPSTSVASGTVLAVWTPCQLVLIDYGNGWWGMYLHMANIQVASGNTVKTGTIIGYPTTTKPTLKACGSVESTAEHVHFVLLNGSGTTGTYVSLLGKVLCGHAVVELNNDATNIILQGLTQTKDQVFQVPACGASKNTITEFPTPGGSTTLEITSGPDGNLWFTEGAQTTDKIGRITPSGVITEFPLSTTNTTSYGITTGPDGNLWFTQAQANEIGRITPSGAVTEFSIPTANSYPYRITAGPDGNLWFTENYGNNIGRITPSGIVTEFSIPTANSSPTGITTGPDGNLWFTEYMNVIGRITPSGVITEFPLPITAYSYPADITTGSDGNLWFTEYNSNGNKIGRMTPSGTVTEFPLPTANSHPEGITSGPDGNLWFAEQGTNKVGRITTSGTITEFSTTDYTVGITSGPDGNLWFTEPLGYIGRITP